jgi:hypothetical protein
MDQVTQRAAANSEESSSAAEELASQAVELAAMIGKFELGGSQSSVRTTSRATNNRTLQARRQPGGSNTIQTTAHEMMPMDDDPDFAEF